MKPTMTLPPPPMRGVPELGGWLRRNRVAAVTVLADPAVVDQPITAAVRAQAASVGSAPRLIEGTGHGNLDEIRALADRLAEHEIVLGVGGGTILDLAKLAVLTATRPEGWQRITAPQRSGMVALPPHLGNSVRVVAVPTTLGTGSELGTVACFEQAGAKRLVTGPCLRPMAAVWDAAATATLPVDHVADGVLEALFRTVSAYVGDPTTLPEQDALVEELAGRLIRLGDAVADRRRIGAPIDADLRLRIAECSGESQIGLINAGRSPYAVKGWPIANELSTTLGLPKMRAVAAVWPVLWRRIDDGDSRLGDAGRLRRLWAELRRRVPRLAPEPSAGLVGLIDEWDIRRHVRATPDAIDTAVTRAMRAWGAGLPMLGGMTAADLRELLAEATEPPDPPRASAAPQSSRQGVALLT
ncbi:daptide-type RiPP biosynthesis dehydogenase [Micromonospora sp. SL4-19]|uniref:daptide-type RiPP biosynthesis dehydogenase n=1 Tax=Micromonospora sp. SL4-19 TaxID=3399129 RepID=UPI003A4E5083